MMHRRVLLFLLAVPLLLLTTFSQLNVKTDISAFFISGKSEQMKLLASQMQTGEISKRYLISIVQDGEDDQALEFVDALQAALLQVNGVSQVWGEGLSESDMHALIAFYLPYRYHLYSLEPEKEMVEAFSAASMQARAQAIKQSLLSPQSAWIKKIISQDPMFMMSHGFGQLSNRVSTGKDDHYTPLIVETEASGLDTARQSLIKQKIETIFRQINQDYGSIYSLEMTGVPVFALAIKKQVANDVTWISSVSTTLMVILFLMMFRSVQSLLTVMIVLLVSAAMATLFTSLIFGEIYALTLALGTTLIGICVDYPIHTMVHAQGSDESPVAASKRIWPSLILGATTTMVGYAALSFTGYPGMQQIALYSAVGILTSLLISRFILPFSIHSQKKILQASFQLNTWLHLGQNKSFRTAILLVALLVLSMGVSEVEWEDDLSQLSPSMTSLKEKDQTIRARMQSIEPGRFILIHATTMEEALQANERASLRLKLLKQGGNLDVYYGLYPWLGSQKLQQRNINIAQLQLTDQTRRKWKYQLEQEGLRSASFGKPEVPNVKPLALQDVLRSPAGRFIAGQYVQYDKEVILTIWLGLHDPVAISEAFAGDPQIQYVSQKDMINEMNAAYRSKAVTALGYGALFIMCLLAFRYRSFKTSLQTLLPAIVAVVFVVGLWGLFGHPLSILHVLGLLLVVAICVDYGIFFHENRSGDIRLTYQAIVMSALTTMLAFFCLALAENAALQILAWTIAPGVLLGFLLCPLLIQKSQQG